MLNKFNVERGVHRKATGSLWIFHLMPVLAGLNMNIGRQAGG
jgi:hypothetical protein